MENKTKTRKIDETVEKTTGVLGSRFALISRMKIEAWKGYLALFFMAGLATAIILSVQTNIQTKSSANSTVAVDRKAELAQIQEAIKTKKAKWVAKDNPIFELSDAERKQRANAKVPSAADVQQHTGPVAPVAGVLPATLDWRNNNGNFVTPVRNQGGCGSCWAFGTTATLESYTLIKNNQPGTDLDLSEQTVLSCSGGGTCGGGYHSTASSFIQSTGVPVESCFPYAGADLACSNACANWQASAYKVGAYSYVIGGYATSSSLATIKQALVNGPVVTWFQVYSDFMGYGGGIYSYTTGSYLGNHIVSIVGYDDAGQYLIAKNSWGSGWGEGGFFRIAYSEVGGTSQFGSWTIQYSGSIPPPNNDTTPPTASITSPANGATVSGTTSINVSASDNVGVSKVEIYIDGTLKATDTSSPYTYSWNTASVANGSHPISAKAYDAAGNVGSASPVTVTVSNMPDTMPPTVTISSPIPGGTYAKSMKISAKGYDNVAVTSMKAMIDGSPVCNSTSGSLSCTIQSRRYSKGGHTITVTASDAAGNTTNPPASVNVNF